MNRIEREKQTVRKMIGLYCRHHLKQDTMPEEYRFLAEYACQRLDHCKYYERYTTEEALEAAVKSYGGLK